MKTRRALSTFGLCVFLFLAGPSGLFGHQADDVEDTRIKKFPMAVQCYSFRNFTFMETLQKIKDLGLTHVQPYVGQRFSSDQPDVVFDHSLSPENIERVLSRLKELGLAMSGYGVVNFENNEESMRKVFDFARKMQIPTIVSEPDFENFDLLEKMVRKYRIQIAIHNHPGPAKYSLPEDVLARVEGRDDRIGGCGDTGHWMRTSIGPVEALRKLEGRLIDVHLKDLSEFGETSARDVPYGQGKADIRAILAELTRQNYAGFITIEYESEPDDPSPFIEEGIEFIRSVTHYEGYEEILVRQGKRYSKKGWNHYGPGYFILDENTGVLKSQGGMGLFWYSVKKYKDFVLEVEFKCENRSTNSGVFVRVPGVPTSDDYIYHSFEVQIDDAGKGIHGTGAAYDAEPPSGQASKNPGEWNHFKITFVGSRLSVALNGIPVLDWMAEARGKVRDFADEGYIGLQNHDSRSPVYFRNIFVKEVK
jgi:sugar phosphate isomerase/epimerase